MVPNGATRTNIQPPPLPVLVVGLPLPTLGLALTVVVGLADGLRLGCVVAIDENG